MSSLTKRAKASADFTASCSIFTRFAIDARGRGATRHDSVPRLVLTHLLTHGEQALTLQALDAFLLDRRITSGHVGMVCQPYIAKP